MIEVKLPTIDEDHNESSIIFWHKQVGDAIQKGDVLVEVQTKKAVTEIEADSDGIMNEIIVKRGEVASVGDVLCTIDQEGNGTELKEINAKESKTSKQVSEKQGESTFVRVSPRLRKVAKELKVALTDVKGTGSGGKITEQDIRNTAEGSESTSSRETGTQLTGIRKTIATRMKQSLQDSAQLTETAYADVTELAKVRENSTPTVGWNTWLMYVAIKALKQNKGLNAHVENDWYTQYQEVHLGFATDTEDGLIVPVVKNAHLLHLVDLNKKIAELVTSVRNKKIHSKDLSGSTFTVTNLGSFGVHFFTPIINPPEVAILGLGKIETYVVLKDGIPQERKRLPISLTFDHQVIDGAPAGRFIKSFVELLEHPDRLSE